MRVIPPSADCTPQFAYEVMTKGNAARFSGDECSAVDLALDVDDFARSDNLRVA
ncbi:hypothetical protein G3480_03890 [Thiorhodococcus mannitoliphagus]|uniref:Uncharacterized protein n=1 Tax=Thiorhodococcus mannitoliphagus TaxID=329406 RepID=A0A6P1DQN0_9GAMM|nr:hypothetical protein [Thiorhodococcus mannitoliphagus]NEX19463.1 hypothetical protein [Thiorhodococcus mannitoliphagus]